MVAYYLLTQISRAFSSMPGLATSIALQIRNGEIKKYLIQPVDLIGFLLLSRVAHKLVYYVVAVGPVRAGVLSVPRLLPRLARRRTMLAAFVASLVMSFLLGFFLEATLGMIGFWFLEVSSLLFVYMLFTFLLLGAHVSDRHAARRTGARSCGPCRCNTWPTFRPPCSWERFKAPSWPGDWRFKLAWVVFFIVLCRVTFHRGVKRYSGYGG